jgi:hypothetical protein
MNVEMSFVSRRRPAPPSDDGVAERPEAAIIPKEELILWKY